jgi:hypothetical protein
MSAYRSLSMAVRNEERAFAFWTYVVAHAEHADVRRAAEAMAGEELGHVASLRRERRRAFHAQRSAVKADSVGAAELERRFAEACDKLAQSARSSDADRLRKFAAIARDTAQELAGEPQSGRGGPLRDSGVPDDPVALAELLVEHYLELAEETKDEKLLARSQALAGLAIDRLAWLRADLPEIERR